MTVRGASSGFRARAKVPERVRVGESITVRTLLSHPMHTGHRLDADGRRIPRRTVERFVATFDGELVFACNVGPSVARNPYFEFRARLRRSGRFRFVWLEGGGEIVVLEREVTVA